MQKMKLGINLDVIVLSALINVLSLAVPIVLLQVYDRILPNQAFSTATLLFVGAVVALFLEGCLRLIRTFILSNFAEEFEYTSAVTALRKLFRSDMAATLNMGSGALKQRLNDINSLREHYSGQTALVFFDLPFAFLFLAAIWYIGREIVVVPLTLFTIAVICTIIAGKSLQNASRKTSDTEDDRLNYITNILNTLTSIKCLGGERLALRIFRDKSRKLISERTGLDRLSHAVSDFISLLGSLTTIVTVIVGAIFVMQGKLTTGGLAACTILAGRSLAPVVSFMMLWTQLQRTWVAKERMDELWQLPEDRVFSPESERKPANGSIVMRNVSVTRGDSTFTFDMSLDSGTKCLLDDPSGKRLALFMGLLIGSTKPDSGDLLVGGHKLQDYTRSTYRQSVAFISRRSQIFRGSILENLTLFQPALEKRAFELASLIGLTDFIHTLPSGFKTQVGDMIGGPLETGTIQRMAIVRALVNDPAVLFLNEADEGIDLAGKRQLAELIQKVEGITVLLLPADEALRGVCPETLSLETVCRVETLPREEAGGAAA